MILRVLLVVHAVITFAAGVVLVVVPAAIPNVIGIQLASDSFIICYLLAAAEVGIAYLS
jgi:multisubunit Na+/H+ antiporter MnhC subunit